MNAANSYFEKIIFPLGRYFWNFSVVIGFVFFGIAGIYYSNSFPKQILSLEDWSKKGGTLTENYSEYETKLLIHNRNASESLTDSQAFAFGGICLLLLGSSMSVLYSIERNTRKD